VGQVHAALEGPIGSIRLGSTAKLDESACRGTQRLGSATPGKGSSPPSIDGRRCNVTTNRRTNAQRQQDYRTRKRNARVTAPPICASEDCGCRIESLGNYGLGEVFVRDTTMCAIHGIGKHSTNGVTQGVEAADGLLDTANTGNLPLIDIDQGEDLGLDRPAEQLTESASRAAGDEGDNCTSPTTSESTADDFAGDAQPTTRAHSRRAKGKDTQP
jgi:hypothetical protein